MNRQNFSLINGFPLNQAALGRMQDAYSIFNAFGNIVGDKSIITGCEVASSNTSDGVVYVGGETYKFIGGITQTKVVIKEDTTPLIFKDNNAYPVVKTRYVTFGTGVGAMDWADFKRGFPTSAIDALVQRIVALEARPTVGNIPIGLVALWGRPANEIPAGWREYKPLKGRMPVGFNESDPDFDVVQKFDGSKTKTLSENELPVIDKTFNSNTAIDWGSGSAIVQRTNSNTSGSGTIISTRVTFGGGQSFSMMNPYRVVHFIEYTGV